MAAPVSPPASMGGVTSYGGMCSSSDARATAAGVQMLAHGGNAVDAAVATAFALAVFEPAMSHLGGQGNMLVHLAESGETTALDFYACAPGETRSDMYRWIDSDTQGGYRFWTEGDRNTTGALSVAIPGNVCGWVTAHQRWGSLPLSQVVGPAAQGARSARLGRRMANFAAENAGRLVQFPASAASFLRPDGSPKEAGEPVDQAGLAETIERIGEDGLESFYRGDLAKRIVSHVREAGGVLSLDDLARYPEELLLVRKPDCVEFAGCEILGATPSSSALLLHLLRVIDGLELDQREPLSADWLHLMIEAMKLAFADRARHIADDRFVNLPLAGMLSPEYARARRSLIDARQAGSPAPGDPWAFQQEQPDPTKFTPPAPAEANGECGTTHHSHVDRWGNFVSMTQSLGDGFGSCVTVPGTGILLNNAMKLFDPRPGPRAHGIRPHARPLAPWPTMVRRKDGPAVMALGSPSGTRIPNALAQTLTHILVHGQDLQAAVDLPRVHWSGEELEVESRIPAEVLDDLGRRGHDPHVRGEMSPWFGAVQAVSRHPETGLCTGAADRRRDGAASGLTDWRPPRWAADLTTQGSA